MAFDNVREDIRRHLQSGRSLTCWRGLQLVATRPTLWAVLSYRVGRWINTHRVPLVSKVLTILHGIFEWCVIEILFGIHIQWLADFGPGLLIERPGNIWVGPIVAGAQCTLSHEVTLGMGRGGGAPRLGHRVTIGPGAKVYGPIVVGDDVVIGPNAVVSKSIPSGAWVIGNPGKVLRRGPGTETAAPDDAAAG